MSDTQKLPEHILWPDERISYQQLQDFEAEKLLIKDKPMSNNNETINSGIGMDSILNPEQERAHAKLVSQGAEKERTRTVPAGMTLDKETGELIRKPVCRPPSDWNPLTDILPGIPKRCLTARIDSDDELLQQSTED